MHTACTLDATHCTHLHKAHCTHTACHTLHPPALGTLHTHTAPTCTRHTAHTLHATQHLQQQQELSSWLPPPPDAGCLDLPIDANVDVAVELLPSWPYHTDGQRVIQRVDGYSSPADFLLYLPRCGAGRGTHCAVRIRVSRAGLGV